MRPGPSEARVTAGSRTPATTSNPRRASSSATARPNPRPAPVTNATPPGSMPRNLSVEQLGQCGRRRVVAPDGVVFGQVTAGDRAVHDPHDDAAVPRRGEQLVDPGVADVPPGRGAV